MRKQPLSLEERKVLESWLKKGAGTSRICHEMDRTRGVIEYEIKRHSFNGTYNAEKAHELYLQGKVDYANSLKKSLSPSQVKTVKKMAADRKKPEEIAVFLGTGVLPVRRAMYQNNILFFSRGMWVATKNPDWRDTEEVSAPVIDSIDIFHTVRNKMKEFLKELDKLESQIKKGLN